MTELGSLTYLRPCSASDDAFLYDVFCTTWEDEVAALPNQNLAQHVLRIQHIAQERRFAASHPGHQRFVVIEDGEPAGRLYLHTDETSLRILDVTLLPRFRERGIGSRIVRDLCELAARENRSVALRVVRKEADVTALCMSLGFRLVEMDDLANHLEWTVPAEVGSDPTVVRSCADSR